MDKKIPLNIKIKFYFFRLARHLWIGLLGDIVFLVISILVFRINLYMILAIFVAEKIVLYAPIFSGRFLKEVILGIHPKIYSSNENNNNNKN